MQLARIQHQKHLQRFLSSKTLKIMFLSAFGSISVFHFPSSFLSLSSWLSIFLFLCFYLYIPSFFLVFYPSLFLSLIFCLSFPLSVATRMSKKWKTKTTVKLKLYLRSVRYLISKCQTQNFSISKLIFILCFE
jgi:CBS domain containing-hemolysin-like protein